MQKEFFSCGYILKDALYNLSTTFFLWQSPSLGLLFLPYCLLLPVNNAVAYNLPYGIYYYAHTAIIDKANWVDMQIKTYLNGQNPPLGIWYDAEDKSMLKNNINVAYMIGNFINRLNELNYNYVGLYSSYNWLTNIIDLNLLADYIPIWSAQYYHENSFKLEYPNRICKIWPYTDHKQIDDMILDCNIYYA